MSNSLGEIVLEALAVGAGSEEVRDPRHSRPRRSDCCHTAPAGNAKRARELRMIRRDDEHSLEQQRLAFGRARDRAHSPAVDFELSRRPVSRVDAERRDRRRRRVTDPPCHRLQAGNAHVAAVQIELPSELPLVDEPGVAAGHAPLHGNLLRAAFGEIRFLRRALPAADEHARRVAQETQGAGNLVGVARFEERPIERDVPRG
jgi:hypothetical protein